MHLLNTSPRASMVQRWPFNKSIFNRDPYGSIHYCSNTGSSTFVATRNCASPLPKPAHYCTCEQLVWFIKCFPHYVLKRRRQKTKDEGTAGESEDDGGLWFSPIVLEVKYDWLVHSWVDMPSLQMKPVNSMCTDWGRMKSQTCCDCHMANIMVGWPGLSSSRVGEL